MLFIIETQSSLNEVLSTPVILQNVSNNYQRNSKVRKQLIFDTKNHSQSSLSNYTKLPKCTGKLKVGNRWYFNIWKGVTESTD